MTYTFKEILDEMPKVSRTRGEGKPGVDYSEEIGFITQLEVGKVGVVGFGPKDGSEFGDTTFKTFAGKLRAAGRRIDKTVTSVWRKGDVYVTVTDGVKQIVRTKRAASAESTVNEDGTDNAPSDSEAATPAPHRTRGERAEAVTV